MNTHDSTPSTVLTNNKVTRRAMIAERQKNSLFWQAVHLLGSLQLALLLLATIGIACAVATFAESRFDTGVAHAYIYKAPWFMAWLTLLCINLFAVTLTRWPWERKHAGFIITHYGIITLLIGAIIGSTLGFEGNVTLHVHGEPVRKITTRQSVLQIESPADTYLYLLPFDASVTRPSERHPTTLTIPGTSLHMIINDWSDHLQQEPLLVPSQETSAKEVVLLKLSSQALHQEETVVLNLGEGAANTFDFFGLASLHLLSKLPPPLQKTDHESQLIMAHFAPVIITQETPSGIQIQLSKDGKLVTIIAPDGTSASYAREALLGKKITVGPSSVTIREYWPDLKLVKGKPTTLSQQPNNPALRAEITTSSESLTPPIEERGTSLTSLDHGTTAPAPAPTSKPWLQVALDAETNHVSYQLGRGKTLKKAGSLAAREKLPLGWADWQLELLEARHQGTVTYTTFPAEKSSSEKGAALTGPPGFHAYLKEKTDQGPPQWVVSGEVTPLTIDSKIVRVGYGLELKPIPFSIELLDFQVPRDEGTETPGDFRATVRFTNLKTEKSQDGLIHMNHPASFPGTFWANFTGINYKFSQAEWNPRDLSETTLQVLYDPGWLFKWIGSLGICGGIAMMFYFGKKK